jgi:hypothetical protein
MKKIALGALLVLLLTIGFSVYYLLSNLDGIVKTAIETYGSEATQTPVRVANVKIVLQDGSGAIEGLTVNNPQGFAEVKAFSLGKVATQIDLKSLSEDVPVIEHVTIKAPEIFFELNQSGKNNLAALMDNLKATSSGSPADKGSSGSEPKLIIRKLLFSDGNIHAKVVPLNKDYELKLPNIQMNNIGGKSGATPKQIADQILKVLTDRALAAVKKQGIDQYKAQLEGEVKKRIDAEKEKIGGQAQEALKGLLDKK